MTCLSINISDTVRHETIQTRREAEGKPWEIVMILGRKIREDGKARQSESTLILLLRPNAMGKKKKGLHSHKHHLTRSVFLYHKPCVVPKNHSGQWPQRKVQLSYKEGLCLQSYVDPKDHTFKGFCSPSTLEEIHWSFRYCFVLHKNTLRGENKKKQLR